MEPKLLITRNVPSEWQDISVVGWEDKFSYCPEVKFRMWHTGELLHLEYLVREQGTRALQNVLGGPVYQDSCVECFIRPDDDPHYYNFEFNPIGMMAMARRTSRHDPEDAPQEVLRSVRISATAGSETFEEKHIDEWGLKVEIPASALFGHDIASWAGKTMKMNLYKCGDGLKVPHYVTWQKVGTENPDYHRPEFFVPVRFEE